MPDLKQWEGSVTECEDARGRRERRYLPLSVEAKVWSGKGFMEEDSQRRKEKFPGGRECGI